VGALVIIGLAIFNFVETDNISLSGLLGEPEITVDEVLELPFDSALEELS
jgi:hypothetical protein